MFAEKKTRKVFIGLITCYKHGLKPLPLTDIIRLKLGALYEKAFLRFVQLFFFFNQN